VNTILPYFILMEKVGRRGGRRERRGKREEGGEERRRRGEGRGE
jgi:hypothetical protein